MREVRTVISWSFRLCLTYLYHCIPQRDAYCRRVRLFLDYGYCFSVLRFLTTWRRLKRALERVDAGPGGSNMVYWTSLREVNLSFSLLIR